MVICITKQNIMNEIRSFGYSLTSTKGNGLDVKNIIFIMTTRRKKGKLIEILKNLDANAFIISGNFGQEKSYS